MSGLEKLCIHKGNGCDKSDTCNGIGQYKEDGRTKHCYRCVYDERELWDNYQANLG